MCSLIVLRGCHADYPLLIAANRDERTDRKAAPPGVFEGGRRRLLSPRDRVAGGTWLCISGDGRFAGITNLAGVSPVVDAPSRGHLPHLALDQDDLDAGVAAVLARLEEHAHSGFQLVVADRTRIVVIRHAGGDVRQIEWREPCLVVTNEHEAGVLTPPGLAAAMADGLDVEQRLAALGQVLVEPGGDGRHAVLKRGEHYGTVSSSLIALPQGDVSELIWRYAPGPPDETPYRNYGNLGRRLLG